MTAAFHSGNSKLTHGSLLWSSEGFLVRETDPVLDGHGGGLEEAASPIDTVLAAYGKDGARVAFPGPDQ